MSWFTSLPFQVQAALIGVVSALAVVLLRDVAVRYLFDRRKERAEKRKAALTVYSTYADPLASAATNLFWRLREVFYEPERAAFLSLPEPITEYQIYKRNSTTYRLAALLGWIRALRRELSFFTIDDRTRLQSVERAMYKLESALADGAHVEVQRVEGLANLWGLKLPEDAKKKSAISVEIERAVKTQHNLAELTQVRKLHNDKQTEACVTAASILYRCLDQESPIGRAILQETLPQAVETLSVREAWLYRDRQAAIGDLMLNETASDRRRFEVKGYADFIHMMDNKKSERQWLNLLNKMFQELDVFGSDDSDARVLQLKRTLIATAMLLSALARVKQRVGSVSKDTVAAAQIVLKDLK